MEKSYTVGLQEPSPWSQFCLGLWFFLCLVFGSLLIPLVFSFIDWLLRAAHDFSFFTDVFFFCFCCGRVSQSETLMLDVGGGNDGTLEPLFM